MKLFISDCLTSAEAKKVHDAKYDLICFASESGVGKIWGSKFPQAAPTKSTIQKLFWGRMFQKDVDALYLYLGSIRSLDDNLPTMRVTLKALIIRTVLVVGIPVVLITKDGVVNSVLRIDCDPDELYELDPKWDGIIQLPAELVFYRKLRAVERKLAENQQLLYREQLESRGFAPADLINIQVWQNAFDVQLPPLALETEGVYRSANRYLTWCASRGIQVTDDYRYCTCGHAFSVKARLSDCAYQVGAVEMTGTVEEVATSVQCPSCLTIWNQDDLYPEDDGYSEDLPTGLLNGRRYLWTEDYFCIL